MNGASEFITIKKATKAYGISSRLLTNWEDKGCIKSTRTPLGTRIYRRSDLEYTLGIHSTPTQKPSFCYCRVSSSKQKDDLERQTEYLRSIYPSHIVIQDVGSGINFSRKGLQTILEHAMRGNIEELVVAYKDRLARFAFDLIETVVEKGGGRITVLDNQKYQSQEQELADDLLAIVHVFSCKQMGRRRYGDKKSQIENIPNQKTEGNTETVVRDVPVRI